IEATQLAFTAEAQLGLARRSVAMTPAFLWSRQRSAATVHQLSAASLRQIASERSRVAERVEFLAQDRHRAFGPPFDSLLHEFRLGQDLGPFRVVNVLELVRRRRSRDLATRML